jgi:ectoine hydroxylase-related dioxygenase (phytanoyl-CoA dioxygenase family)
VTVEESFRRDGACVVRGLLDAAELARLEEAVERNIAEPSERAIAGGGENGSGRFFEDFRNWERITGYEDVIRRSRIGEVAARVMGSSGVRLHHDHLLVKEPGTTIRTPWHQDQPFYDIDGADTVSFWIPLDPVPRESTLEFVAGSHATRTWYMPRGFFDDRPMVFEDGTFADVPDVEADRGAHCILGWELEPGDAVAFNMLTLHAAGGARNRRRAFSVRICGDDVTLAARPHPTSPSFPELEGALAHGDALDHPLFPVLWSS